MPLSGARFPDAFIAAKRSYRMVMAGEDDLDAVAVELVPDGIHERLVAVLAGAVPRVVPIGQGTAARVGRQVVPQPRAGRVRCRTRRSQQFAVERVDPPGPRGYRRSSRACSVRRGPQVASSRRRRPSGSRGCPAPEGGCGLRPRRGRSSSRTRPSGSILVDVVAEREDRPGDAIDELRRLGVEIRVAVGDVARADEDLGRRPAASRSRNSRRRGGWVAMIVAAGVRRRRLAASAEARGRSAFGDRRHGCEAVAAGEAEPVATRRPDEDCRMGDRQGHDRDARDRAWRPPGTDAGQEQLPGWPRPAAGQPNGSYRRHRVASGSATGRCDLRGTQVARLCCSPWTTQHPDGLHGPAITRRSRASGHHPRGPASRQPCLDRDRSGASRHPDGGHARGDDANDGRTPATGSADAADGDITAVVAAARGSVVTITADGMASNGLTLRSPPRAWARA